MVILPLLLVPLQLGFGSALLSSVCTVLQLHVTLNPPLAAKPGLARARHAVDLTGTGAEEPKQRIREMGSKKDD